MAAHYTLPQSLSTIILVLSNYYVGQGLIPHQTGYGQGRTDSRLIRNPGG
jgi:hypothetical protein